ncbi:hypothetical protein [Pseudomonas fontis]|uniref:Uncharacterized protein n=1 Tax=Pseudomonas fontis TaxID=2942633 RepID=A0ABT5NNN3_9PSED|nr:hypothetical protein [Pseudomonas fontis]MDD0976008.1 hypothetical protein [Pseudomonas fontis]MDD0989758.1 hypothetical protein [Pseudomonas fontis]
MIVSSPRCNQHPHNTPVKRATAIFGKKYKFNEINTDFDIVRDTIFLTLILDDSADDMVELSFDANSRNGAPHSVEDPGVGVYVRVRNERWGNFGGTVSCTYNAATSQAKGTFKLFNKDSTQPYDLIEGEYDIFVAR